MGMNVVIVESPAKAKTINKYLGKDYKVLASYGHIRDLPSKDGSVRPDEDFAMSWDVDSQSAKRLKEISDAVKGSDRLILATDPDREGEAISWHLLEVLREKGVLKDVSIDRVVFNAITKNAVLDAMKNPRQLDTELVDAYLARRALDYLVGFTLSPVLWRKLPGSRSAGRVQSVALRIICQREIEIESFVPQEYWTLQSNVTTKDKDSFTARLVTHLGNKLKKFDLGNEADAMGAKAAVEAGQFSVASVESKPTKRNPPPPFTTSTLQQEASRKLGFSASRTMQLAQRLYEGADIGGETMGLITYMRTDGVGMAPEALEETRSVIGTDFGDRYVPDQPRVYKTKAKNAQEAHEAIRPTALTRRPKEVGSYVDADQLKLYELIWKRAVASQIASAELERTTIELATPDKQTGLRATGSVVVFDGFLRLYEEGRDDSGDDESDGRLPKVNVGDAVSLDKILPEQHFTEPPPRFTEATLVKKLEELGIGRPSTYASTLSVLRDRAYVRIENKRFFPEDKGRLVTAFLESFFTRYVEYDFTASLEEQLDHISAGEMNWKTFLKNFWDEFQSTVDGIADLRITHVLDALNEVLGPHVFPPREDGKDPRTCPSCDDGKLSLKVGRYGAFVGCSNYPDCKFTRQLAAGDGDGLDANEPKVLGQDPETGHDVSLRTGRFGPYVQLGEEAEGEKPKRTGLPKGTDPMSVELDRALALLSLPRDLGPHPEDGKKMVVGIGRFGPYVRHDGVYASIKDPEEVFTIGANRAVTLLAEKRANPGRGRTAAKPLRELGAHPEDGEPVNVMEGRYGPYVKHGKINATITKDFTPDAITLEQAVELVAAKTAKGPKKKTAKKKTAKKKTAKKKTTKKKTAKKKASKKKTAKKKAAKKDTGADDATE